MREYTIHLMWGWYMIHNGNYFVTAYATEAAARDWLRGVCPWNKPPVLSAV